MLWSLIFLSSCISQSLASPHSLHKRSWEEMARVAGEASEFGQGASRGADAGTAILSPMKGSNTIQGDISMGDLHPIDHSIVQQEAADIGPALG
jgi:hypothetical protein